MKKSLLVCSTILISSICLLTGCSEKKYQVTYTVNGNEIEKSEESGEINETDEIVVEEVQEKEKPLDAIDTTVTEETKYEYEKVDETSISMEKEGNIYKFINLTENNYRDLSGRVIFLDKDKNILNISYAYLGALTSKDYVYYEIYDDGLVPEAYDSYALDLEGIILDDSFKNYKDSIKVETNDNEKGIFAKIINNSDVEINNINLRILYYKEGKVISEDNYSIDRTIKSKEFTYEQVYYRYVEDGIDYGPDYDKYEVIVELASEDNLYDYYIERAE